jgi:hypothetical protein
MSEALSDADKSRSSVGAGGEMSVAQVPEEYRDRLLL